MISLFHSPPAISSDSAILHQGSNLTDGPLYALSYALVQILRSRCLVLVRNPTHEADGEDELVRLVVREDI